MTTFDISNCHYCLSSQIVCADDSKHHNDYTVNDKSSTIQKFHDSLDFIKM